MILILGFTLQIYFLLLRSGRQHFHLLNSLPRALDPHWRPLVTQADAHSPRAMPFHGTSAWTFENPLLPSSLNL